MNGETVHAERAAAVLAAIDEARAPLLDLCARIHGHPELKFAEYQAVRWITDMLAAKGFVVERNVAGLPTAFRAWKASRGWRRDGAGGGPTIVFQAEYDALPAVGHACGHNIIAAAAVGAALGVAAAIRDLPGRVMVMGTPGEEGGGGKILLLEAGAYDDVDVAMYVHAQSRNAVMHGNMALARVEVTFQGQRANPLGGNTRLGEEHKGINALTALLLFWNNLNALRERLPRQTLLRGRITDGGDELELEPVPLAAGAYLKVTSPRYADAQAVLEMIRSCGRAAELATGAAVGFQEFPLYRERLSNRTLMALMERNLRVAGCDDLDTRAVPSPASTDSGNISWRIPLVGAFVKVCDPGINTHSPDFAAAAGSPAGHAAALRGAKGMALTALDVLVRPDLLSRIRQDFAVAVNAASGQDAPS